MKIPRHIKIKKLWAENGKLKGTVVISKLYLAYLSVGLIARECKLKLWQYPTYIKRVIQLIRNTSKEQEIG